jgi:DNA-binding winged helix-turn-helix (wHTH) protein
MTPRRFDVLYLLVKRAGKVVTKDEMLGEIWNGNFVEEGNLSFHICKLRRLLGCSKWDRYIETVYGSGYRFVCRTMEIDEDECLEDPFGNREATAKSLTPEFSEPIVQRIKVANHYVVIRIEVVDGKRERELAARSVC